MNTPPCEFDVDAWARGESESAPIITYPRSCCWSDTFRIRLGQGKKEISVKAVLWITIALCGLNILCLIFFYTDKCT